MVMVGKADRQKHRRMEITRKEENIDMEMSKKIEEGYEMTVRNSRNVEMKGKNRLQVEDRTISVT